MLFFQRFIIFSLLALAFSQGSIEIYTDSACIKVVRVISFDSACTESVKMTCSSDGKNLLRNLYAKRGCTGPITSSVPVGKVGICEPFAPSGFAKYSCIEKSRVLSAILQVVGLDSSAFQITIGFFVISFLICFWIY